MHAAARDAVPTPHPSEFVLPPGELWVFGYGSLMWDPGFPYVKWAPALVYGYHRALCVYSTRWRGTATRPGLVLGLDRGGACRGLAYHVAAADVETALEGLWTREMRRRVYKPRLMRARLADREIRVLTFIADVEHPGYAGRLSIEQTAQLVATRRGHRGSNIDYLRRTIKHLAELGVRDHNLLGVLAAVRALRSGGTG
jgi:cation transport protein ChaC